MAHFDIVSYWVTYLVRKELAIHLKCKFCARKISLPPPKEEKEEEEQVSVQRVMKD